jgi:ABC-2 type transport system permease protein
MISALLYLQAHSMWNRLSVRVRRLRQPKYLFGAIVGLMYLYFYFFRPMRHARSGTNGFAGWEEYGPLIESAGALVLFLVVALGWVLPRGRAALAFSEAEIAFLFPAPISRRTLIHYKLLVSQFSILFSTLILTVISGRLWAGWQAWRFVAAWWLVLSMLNLHLLGASFLRTLLLERGYSNAFRRTLVGLVLLVVIGVFAMWARQMVPPPSLVDLADLKQITGYLQRILETGPVFHALWPFRMVVRPFMATDASSFFSACAPVLLLLVLHYIWVVRSDVAFEEASIALAQKRAELVSAVREGRWQRRSTKKGRAPFHLHPVGLPSVAILWKNLIGIGQTFNWRFWFWICLVIIIPVAVLGRLGQGGLRSVLPLMGMMALMFTGWSILIGPQILRYDFRRDLKNAELLKSYPLRGWEVALGEVLTPAVVLTVLQWLLLLMAAAWMQLPGGEAASLGRRVLVAFSIAVVVLPLNMLSLCIPNCAVLLFPAWFRHGGETQHGIEAIGQRLIFMLGQIVVFTLALIPAGLVAGLVFGVIHYLANWQAALLCAAPVAALVLAMEAALTIHWLGKLFERFDVCETEG